MELLPALDLRRGRAVRLCRGDAARQTTYGEDPLALLARWARLGVRRVHVVDLDAAFGEPPQRELIARLAKAGEREGVAPAALQLGGGLRGREALEWALGTADRIVVGSLLARDPDLFRNLAEEAPGRIVPALDLWAAPAGPSASSEAREEEVRIAGWREKAGRGLAELCGVIAGLPCPAVLVTDVARDGMMTGPNFELARRVARMSGAGTLVSGGVSTLADLAAARAVPEVAGAVVGRALYEGAFTVEEALALLASPEGAPTAPTAVREPV